MQENMISEVAAASEGTPFSKLMGAITSGGAGIPANPEATQALMQSVSKIVPCLNLMKNRSSMTDEAMFAEYEKLGIAYGLDSLPSFSEFNDAKREHFSKLLLKSAEQIPNVNAKNVLEAIDSLIAQPEHEVTQLKIFHTLAKLLGVPPEIMAMIATFM